MSRYRAECEHRRLLELDKMKLAKRVEREQRRACRNLGDVIFQGDDGDEVSWVPGEWHTFRSVDLSSIQVRGQIGDTVTVIGGTW